MRKVSFGALAALLISAVFWLSPTSSEAAGTNAPWWDTSYVHREELSVRVADATLNGYSLSITFNHAALVSAGRSLANGDDVRIVRYDGTTNTELDRVLSITNTPTTFNSATTKIWWRAQAAIPANTVDHSYYLYFGKPSAVSPPANANNVYDLFDDFNNSAFDGTVDASKWSTYITGSGVAVQQTGGVLQISGTPSAGSTSDGMGVTMKLPLTSNRRSDATFRRTASNTNQFKVYSGVTPGNLAWQQGRIAFFNAGWNSLYSPSVLTSTATIPAARISSAITSDFTSRAWENDVLRVVRPSSAVDLFHGNFHYTADTAGATSTAVFDDIVVRKFVATEPVVTLGVAEAPTLRVNIEPVLTFSVAGQGTSCNSATPAIGTATSTALSFGRPAIGTNSIVAQTLVAGTNAGVGISVRLSGSSLLAGAADINPVAGTNVAPAAFGTGEGFGYTTNSTTLFGGTANRFAGAGKWAAVTSAAEPIAYSTPGPLGINNCVAFQTGVAATTISGAYSGTLTYRVTPTF